tara:strand:- start:51 stop:4019 length:3969 start_codon:yes stop_codon:yes gene_type:complete
MSHSWKKSNNKKPIIKATKIFTTSLKSKNNIISVDVSTIDISLDDNITINKIKSLTSDSVETTTIKANTIDLRNYDTSFIVFTNSIFTKKSAGFFELSGQDLSSTNLLSDNTTVNIIESDNSINFTGNVTFNKYVYVDNIDVSIIEQNNNIVVNTNVLINKTLTASEISVNNIITDNSSILINSIMDVSGKIITSDISIIQYLNTPTLKVNDICSNYNKIVINNDLSFHSNLFITDLSAYTINGLDSSLIIVNNELSFNNLLTIGSDISDYDNIQPIDSCYNIVGNFNFSANKKITADLVKVDKITPKADPSAIVFKGDLSINGAVYAKFKYNYAATIDDTSKNRGNLKLGGLLLVYPEGSYTTASLEIFDPNQGNNTSDVRDISLQKSLTAISDTSLDKVRLFIKIDDDNGNPDSNFKIINTINRPPEWKKITVRNEISQYYDVVDDISYVKYDSGVSYNCWDLSENNDISENFDVSSSNIIGLKNRVINDDSYNRVYYFDLSAVDPEQFDVSYLLATKHHDVIDNVTDFSDIKLVKYHNDNNDYSNTRVEITMPIEDVELSFNLAAHDRLNYVIKSLYINVDGLVEPVEPSWNAIQLKAYDICGIGTYGHQRYTDQSWNDDICINNPISNADMTDASAFTFDVSLYRFFHVNNRDRLHYYLDLSAVHNTDLDLSFNIINTLENPNIISLSGNKIIFKNNVEDICNNNNDNNNDNFNVFNSLDNDDFRDISINVLVHNYYQHGGDASFDFSAANQDIVPPDTSFQIPSRYANDPVYYSTDVSRTIVLRICGIVTNQPPNWKEISEIGISYEGSTDFDISFYKDFSFNNQFYDISKTRPLDDFSSSYIYYIWDTSTIDDFSRLQYRIDLSALDPEGFTVDYSYVYNNADYDVSVGGNELFITTPGRRDKDISDLSLVIWPTDRGTLHDASYYDICKNLIFHPFLYKFTEFTFRNCDVSGREGPDKNACEVYYNNEYNNEYSSNNNSSLITWWTDPSYFDMSLDSGIQIWTAPATGLYDITIAGAGGGRSYGPETRKEGFGIKFDTSARLIKGDKYRILVGQRGNLGNDKQINDGFNNTIGNKLPYSSSGGGATFLVKDDIALDTLNYVDISHLVIAVAGGGSGGRTWDTHEVSHTVTDASTVDPSPGANTVGGAEDNRDILIDPYGQAAIGRGIEVNTINGIDISAQGGGGGGGIALDGDLAGTNSSANSFKAQSFRNGGKGGLNIFVNDPTAIGDAKEGGFGGGAAGGDGGSGGGGGYIGGGGDMKSGVDIDVDNKSYAGGGGSYVNEIKYRMKIARDMSNNPDEYESHGFLTIKFNPYNK